MKRIIFKSLAASSLVDCVLAPIGHVSEVFEVFLLLIGQKSRLFWWSQLRLLRCEFFVKVRHVLH